MKQKINSKTLLSDILNLTGAEVILSKYKVPCLTCPMAQYEMQSLTIGDVCKMYGLDLPKLLVELNKLVK
ncbi:hypothetical protein COX74_01520 [bacterium (Candidatus Gribaldobacteria) CG_4_10_14_0_2_um_filter_41_16]|uniref:Disulfide oxidoreductase n=4 Tax=Candidatus Gribaldobacteria TaxID=2798536 RepID=A0A2M7VIJ5_9BACT|nr:MAG: hypothetical protein AUJ36_01180 [Parcubacteria group bacterium CG1_02_41_26]PIR91534.1 MAG: hypothetical protein COU03_01820 [bacterium (Candidatus Gribaldobacteria) CG10_big_fil_rev_8_21_14_0_10_41_12]PIV47031.1 MAG: hypothetical protein COS21_02160 [bacterium (Candidatus Gribaldobacteria) CG02_land_8_20_14_3_00_41_15]PIX02819.1 MAG: hypothetical protein COZ78_03725 [bacterium (Candidatus Gribaldobacteria) CG_4_8_14_3_um_filter_42_11]PJA01671.1 MAG: hypothetical protein COX74_01520 [b